MNRKSGFLLLKIECLLIALVVITISLLKISFLPVPNSSLILVIVNLMAALPLMSQPRRALIIANNFFKLLLIGVFPSSLSLAICLLGAPLVAKLAIANWFVAIIVLTCFGLLSLPFLKVTLLSFQTIGWQIAGSITLMMTFTLMWFSFRFLNFSINIGNPIMWLSFLMSFSISIYAMNQWGYRFPRFRINSKVNYWWLSLAIATGLLNLGMSAGSWSHLFTRFQLIIDTHSLAAISFTILWVGIREEFMFRYLFLWPLLSIKAKSDQKKVVWATLISSGVFGLFHAEHLFSGQQLLQTGLQIFAAFGVGMLFSVITLYTGTIWITVILHLMIDLIGYPMTTSSTFAGSGMPIYLTEFIIITRVIELIVFFLILKNRNAQAAFAQTLRRIRKPNRNHDMLKEG